MKQYGQDQNSVIIRHLREHGTITTLEAMTEHGIMRLGARISELRGKYDILTRLCQTSSGKRFARYSFGGTRCAVA